MMFTFNASCMCHKGKIRVNNEDNLYFDNKCLEKDNDGLKHPVNMKGVLKSGLSMAVFDGMGGEHLGEVASFVAAREMQKTQRTLADLFISDINYLKGLVQKLNSVVIGVQKANKTNRIGTTMVSLYYSRNYVYFCNVGDSRAYRLRNGELLQISNDHIEKMPFPTKGKAPLSRYLGMNEEYEIEPYIAKEKVVSGDVYLLCSDGITDMLTNVEIFDILHRCTDTEACVSELVDCALKSGGRDNITAIVCRIL